MFTINKQYTAMKLLMICITVSVVTSAPLSAIEDPPPTPKPTPPKDDVIQASNQQKPNILTNATLAFDLLADGGFFIMWDQDEFEKAIDTKITRRDLEEDENPGFLITSKGILITRRDLEDDENPGFLITSKGILITRRDLEEDENPGFLINSKGFLITRRDLEDDENPGFLINSKGFLITRRDLEEDENPGFLINSKGFLITRREAGYLWKGADGGELIGWLHPQEAPSDNQRNRRDAVQPGKDDAKEVGFLFTKDGLSLGTDISVKGFLVTKDGFFLNRRSSNQDQ